MTSLTRFRQRLSGELPDKNEQQNIKDWVKLITEPEDPAITTEIHIPSEETIKDREIIIDIESMTKSELDNHAVENGIQLDRRQSKKNMITEFIQKLKEKN